MAGWFSFHVTAATLEEVAPHFATTTEIVWKVPTNQVPKRLWIYGIGPHVFSAATISNAVVLAGFQQKGFPKPSAKATVIWDRIAGSTVGEPRPPYFALTPKRGAIQYDIGDRWPDAPNEILADRAAVEYAWDCLARLGIDRAQFVKTNIASFGVAFPRQIDGIRFQDDSEGFSFQQYGKDRKLRCFCLTLPTLERVKEDTTASPQEIIAAIRAFKVPIMPNGEEADYFARVKAMSKAKRLTITKLSLYYGEGTIGETPPENELPKAVTPVAYLETTADFGTSNAPLTLAAPILSSDVRRLLQTKHGRK
ncbi:MAG TPA: hypothetical protein PKI20_02440 [Verrucomicrobiota bacterium]|nr:hypothetical protein [Verrucomicrobiota bacterium]HQL76667.1 hypothetical protein [Verrucomicrobiota bacterium]